MVKLLSHPHRDVRLEAQFAMAAKGEAGIAALNSVARQGPNRLARLHAIWGLGMIGRKDRGAFEVVERLLTDPDPEVRGSAARVLGDAGRPVWTLLLPLLKDPEPRLRMLAALAIARAGQGGGGLLGGDMAVKVRDGLFAMLRENDDKDGYLRHAGAEALARQVPARLLVDAAKDDTVAVRLAAVVALRRQAAPEVRASLGDANPHVVAEAARAVCDVPIPSAYGHLAPLHNRLDLPASAYYRVANANFLIGRPSNAKALAGLAMLDRIPEGVRVMALKMLGDWAKPPRRDYVTGLTQSLPERPRQDAVDALSPAKIRGMLARAPKPVRAEFIATAAKLDLKEAATELFDLARGDNEAPEIRVEALHALEALRDSRLGQAAT